MPDYGPTPIVVNLEDVAEINNDFRTVLWTGNYLQITLMSINIGGDIGLEMHPNVDQLIRIEDGEGLVRMGNSRDDLSFQRRVDSDDAIVVPAGTWHNVINTGDEPLKISSVYAPPRYSFGTVQTTRA